jgi:hypothetical protein
VVGQQAADPLEQRRVARQEGLPVGGAVRRAPEPRFPPGVAERLDLGEEVRLGRGVELVARPPVLHAARPGGVDVHDDVVAGEGEECEAAGERVEGVLLGAEPPCLGERRQDRGVVALGAVRVDGEAEQHQRAILPVVDGQREVRVRRRCGRRRRGASSPEGRRCAG